ncbi:hypothetical protein IJ732_00800 [bacterium]|nr:hypothetical protein [bacterium]
MDLSVKYPQTTNTTNTTNTNNQNTNTNNNTGVSDNDTFTGFTYKNCVKHETRTIVGGGGGGGGSNSGTKAPDNNEDSNIQKWASTISGCIKDLTQGAKDICEMLGKSGDTPTLTDYSTSEATAALDDVNAKIAAWGDSDRLDVTGTMEKTSANLAIVHKSGDTAVSAAGALEKSISASTAEMEKLGSKTDTEVEETKNDQDQAEVSNDKAEEAVEDTEEKTEEAVEGTEESAQTSKEQTDELKSKTEEQTGKLTEAKNKANEAWGKAKDYTKGLETELSELEVVEEPGPAPADDSQEAKAAWNQQKIDYQQYIQEKSRLEGEIKKAKEAEGEAETKFKEADTALGNYLTESGSKISEFEANADKAENAVTDAKTNAKNAMSMANANASRTEKSLETANKNAETAIKNKQSLDKQSEAMRNKNDVAKDLSAQLKDRGARAKSFTQTIDKAPDKVSGQQATSQAGGTVGAVGQQGGGAGGTGSGTAVGGGDGDGNGRGSVLKQQVAQTANQQTVFRSNGYKTTTTSSGETVSASGLQARYRQDAQKALAEFKQYGSLHEDDVSSAIHTLKMLELAESNNTNEGYISDASKLAKELRAELQKSGYIK